MSDTDGARNRQSSQSGFVDMKPVKRFLFFVFGMILLWGLIHFRDDLSLNAMAHREAELREYQSQYPVRSIAIAFVLYATVTGISFPGAAGLSLLCGWLFGFRTGLILVSFASTTGATAAFLTSRFFFRDWVQAKYGKSLEKFNQAFQQEGAFYLFMLRLIPAVPFFVINLVMGLMPIRTPTFWWVSQLGMLPGTIIYLYAGSSVPSINEFAEKGLSGLMTPNLWIAFGLLAIFPFLIRRVYALFVARQITIHEETSTHGTEHSDKSKPADSR